MNAPTTLRLSAFALLMFAVPSVRADQISWNYDFSSTTSVQSTGAPGSVVLTPFKGSITGSEPMMTTITAANLQAFSSAAAGNPARFNNAEYTLTMRLTDASSGLAVAVTFEGVLNGTVSAAGSSLTNTFIGQKSFTYNLDHHIYDIAVGFVKDPGAPGSGDLGRINVNVSVHHNPEPSSLLLCALGVPALGLFRRRR
jgi:hypothetical protein